MPKRERQKAPRQGIAQRPPKAVQESLQAQLQAAQRARAQACMDEINEALRRHRCTLEVQPVNMSKLPNNQVLTQFNIGVAPIPDAPEAEAQQ